MKQIGYIYKYNEDEQKGILVYGHWNRGRCHNNPIKFTLEECKSIIKTGDLVYFEITENSVMNIERASLANFDKEAIENITTWKKGNQSDWYDINTHISFEYLGDIIIPIISEKTTNNQNETDGMSLEELLCDDDFDFSDYISNFETAEDFFEELDNKYLEYKHMSESSLPQRIDDLFDYFGKYSHDSHKYKDNSISIDIFDISLWIDDDILKGDYYGSTTEQFFYICELFINKRRIDDNGNTFVPKRENDCISNSWKLIISHFNDYDLRYIISKYPILQPVFPHKFCLDNIDVLSEHYGMPNVKICKAYNEYLVAECDSASKYEYLCNRFDAYANCCAKHIEGEGVPMCKMGKGYIKKLKGTLDEKFENVIAINIKGLFEKFTGTNFDSLSFIDDKQKNEKLILVGVFFEAYKNAEHSLISFEKRYKELPTDCKDLLYQLTRNRINDAIIRLSENTQTLPSYLRFKLSELKEWIDESTHENVTRIVNPRFSAIDDLSELQEAYDADFITDKQYNKKFRSLTENFSIYQLAKELTSKFLINKRFPLITQWYLVSRIIKLFNFTSLKSEKYVILENKKRISNVRSLMKWVNEQYEHKNIDKRIVEKAQALIFKVLSEEEKWTLFEEGLVTTPGPTNIEEKLNIAYKEKNFDSQMFKKECFQDVMYRDIQSINDINLKLLVAEHLDSKHQNLLQSKSSGVMKLFLWTNNLSENNNQLIISLHEEFDFVPEYNESYDWNLITSYFAELPAKQQIKLFRYIVFLIAKKDITLSVNELYDLFVCAKKKSCPAICGILYMLKAKISAPSAIISSEIMEKEADMEDGCNHDFLLIKDFFYECNGHLALTCEEPKKEHQFYNGYVDILDKTDKYIVSFYDRPLDGRGYEVDWLNDECILQAKSVLAINFNTLNHSDSLMPFEFDIDPSFIIDPSYKDALKEFAMAYDIDDNCFLLDPVCRNYLRSYDVGYQVCRDINHRDTDPTLGIPFYWCDKKPCVRRCHYILPLTEWEKYKFSDLLYILSGSEKSALRQIWSITSEISQFIHEYIDRFERDINRFFRIDTDIDIKMKQKQIIYSHSLRESDEIGFFTDDFSILFEEGFDDEENGCYQDFNYEDVSQDIPTYERYNGSYAQDEMGYSDDDIDTIFDGDPSAYWNID